MGLEKDSALGSLIALLSGQKRSGTAVVIPSGHSRALLEMHLSKLEAQSDKDFDVLVIGTAPQRGFPALNLLIFDELVPLGSSGGFGVGQVMAYTLGYEFIINADVDCFPYSPDLIGVLKARARSEGKVVLPPCCEERHIDAQTGLPRNRDAHSVGYVINQYGIAPRSVLERIGFLYFPIFKGAEDYEFGQRLAAHGLVAHEDSVVCTHKTFFFDILLLIKDPGTKYIYYKRAAVFMFILTASYLLRRGRLTGALSHLLKAWLELVKTQLLYSKYPDIRDQVYAGYLLDASRLSPRRTSKPFIVPPREGMRALTLDVGDGPAPAGTLLLPRPRVLDYARRFPPVGFLFAILTSPHEYARPTREFLRCHGTLLPFILLIKPIFYADAVDDDGLKREGSEEQGAIYSSGLSGPELALNLILTGAVGALGLLALPFLLLKALSMPYPVTVANLETNLRWFAGYCARLKEAMARSAP